MLTAIRATATALTAAILLAVPSGIAHPSAPTPGDVFRPAADITGGNIARTFVLPLPLSHR